MEVTGNLQRSAISFRRQGSSGLVWDDKFLTGDPKQTEGGTAGQEEAKGNIGRGSDGVMRRSRSTGSGGGGGRSYRAARMPSPCLDPPSPKVSGCGLCGIFGKPVNSKHRPDFKGKRRS